MSAVRYNAQTATEGRSSAFNALGDPLQSLSHVPSDCAVVVNWTYLRAPWELDGPLNIGMCLEEGHDSFDDAYSTLGALNQSFWTIFVLKNLYTHFTQVLVSSKKNISVSTLNISYACNSLQYRYIC